MSDECLWGDVGILAASPHIMKNSEKTHCKYGHEYTPDNTYWFREKRSCRTCIREAVKRRNKKGGPGYAGALARNRKWREANKEKQRAAILRYQHRRKEWFEEFRRTLFCQECGENHIACLDFHHRDPVTKDGSVAAMANKWTEARFFAEMAKCDVLCSNCHRKLHWRLRQEAKAGEEV